MCSEHQEHKQRGRAEHEQRRRPALLLLESKLGPFETDAGRQHLVGQLLHAVQRCAGRDARCRDAHDFGSREKVVARYAIGSSLVSQPGHRADRHHLTRIVACLKASDIVCVPSKAAIGLGYDFVGSAEIIEIVHILRAEIDLQCGKHVGRGETDLFGFLAIDVGIDRGRAGTEQREDADEVRVLVGGGDKGLRRAREGV